MILCLKESSKDKVSIMRIIFQQRSKKDKALDPRVSYKLGVNLQELQVMSTNLVRKGA